MITCNGSSYVTNIDHEFVALVADDWSTTMDNLLQEAHAYDGPVRMVGKAYDHTTANGSDLLEERYKKNALSRGIWDQNEWWLKPIDIIRYTRNG